MPSPMILPDNWEQVHRNGREYYGLSNFRQLRVGLVDYIVTMVSMFGQPVKDHISILHH